MDYIEKARTKTNGILCHYALRTYTQVWVQRHAPDYCPICNSELKLNDKFYLVINNSCMFPNCLVHARCIIESSSIEGLTWMNFYKTTEQISEKYSAYKNLFKTWAKN